jgi:predicted TIM-barrel fold metal-dependent hydrolase
VFIDAHAHVVPFRIHEAFRRVGLSAIFDHCPGNEMREAIDSLLADMEKAGVDTSLVITACNLGLLEEYSRRIPEKLFVAYLYDSRNPKEGLRALRREVDKHPDLIRCVKTMFPYLGQHPLQKEFAPLYRFCEKRSLPIQFHLGGDSNMESLSNPLYFARLSSLFPKLVIICLHAGGGMIRAMPLLMRLWPNIFLETEALQLEEAEGSRSPNALRYLLQHIDSSRVMFGSDRIFPEEKYFWRVQAARTAVPEHAENLCWKTANRAFNLGLERRRKMSAAKKDVETPEKREKAASGLRSSDKR